jgi:hypothetical protein
MEFPLSQNKPLRFFPPSWHQLAVICMKMAYFFVYESFFCQDTCCFCCLPPPSPAALCLLLTALFRWAMGTVFVVCKSSVLKLLLVPSKILTDNDTCCMQARVASSWAYVYLLVRTWIDRSTSGLSSLWSSNLNASKS